MYSISLADYWLSYHYMHLRRGRETGTFVSDHLNTTLYLSRHPRHAYLARAAPSTPLGPGLNP